MGLEKQTTNIQIDAVSRSCIREPDCVASTATTHAVFMRRQQAGKYCCETYGFGAARTFAKLAVIGGGPEFHQAGRVVLYTKESLDAWALSKLGAARRSTPEKECEV